MPTTPNRAVESLIRALPSAAIRRAALSGYAPDIAALVDAVRNRPATFAKIPAAWVGLAATGLVARDRAAVRSADHRRCTARALNRTRRTPCPVWPGRGGADPSPFETLGPFPAVGPLSAAQFTALLRYDTSWRWAYTAYEPVEVARLLDHHGLADDAVALIHRTLRDGTAGGARGAGYPTFLVGLDWCVTHVPDFDRTLPSLADEAWVDIFLDPGAADRVLDALADGPVRDHVVTAALAFVRDLGAGAWNLDPDTPVASAHLFGDPRHLGYIAARAGALTPQVCGGDALTVWLAQADTATVRRALEADSTDALAKRLLARGEHLDEVVRFAVLDAHAFDGARDAQRALVRHAADYLAGRLGADAARWGAVWPLLDRLSLAAACDTAIAAVA